MQPYMVYSLWNMKPCLDYVILYHSIFRNPASGHRPSRSELGTGVQALVREVLDDYLHCPAVHEATQQSKSVQSPSR